MLIPRLKSRLERFRNDEQGSIAVESLVILPILFWSIMAGYTFFEGYRQSASNIKAAYTIGDLLSRETRTIDHSYIDSMEAMFKLMVRNESDLKMRISYIVYDEATDSHSVPWSVPRGGYTEKLDNANIVSYKDALPVMADQNSLILVETSNTFVPPFRVGLDNIELQNFVFTRPRFTENLQGPAA